MARLVFPSSTEDWREANAILDATPREPGRFKLGFDSEPRWFEWEGDCPDCGRHMTSTGVVFGNRPDDSALYVHWAESCPALKHRLWRLWYCHTYGRLERRYKSWRWRRRARVERKAAGLDG